jgi:hypothetical protein
LEKLPWPLCNPTYKQEIRMTWQPSQLHSSKAQISIPFNIPCAKTICTKFASITRFFQIASMMPCSKTCKVIKRHDSVRKIATEKDFFEKKSSGDATDSLILADSLNSQI